MGKNDKFVITPIVVSCGADPEFIDVAGMRSRFSIGRSLAYLLADEGLIRSVSLRRPGRLRGKKLFHVASVQEYLASLANDVSPECRAQAQRAVCHRRKAEVAA
jgi:hypothetical protein